MHVTARQALDTFGVRDSAGCWCGGATRAVVTLNEGDTAENPIRIEHPLHGPARVAYTQYPDGRIGATVTLDEVITTAFAERVFA